MKHTHKKGSTFDKINIYSKNKSEKACIESMLLIKDEKHSSFTSYNSTSLTVLV